MGKVGFDPVKVNATFNTTIEQVVRPFSIWSSQGTNAARKLSGDNYTTIRYLATLQSLLSIVFITFILLALRWRFKRG